MTLIFNLKSQKQVRRILREQETKAEKILWTKLRNKQFGYRFRRQFGVGKYIVDFYCSKLKLVIEIDGATHATKKEIEYDSHRQKFLENLGLIVKRYTNIDVEKNLRAVLDDIYEVGGPHPDPPLRKGREKYNE